MIPWKLIFLILFILFIIFFSGYNSHKVKILFGPFLTVSDVPLFVIIFISLITGSLLSFPFFIIKSFSKNKKVKKVDKQIKLKVIENNANEKETKTL